MRVGLVQLTVGDDPAENLAQTVALVGKAAAKGASFVLTPECTNGLSGNRAHQRAVFHDEDTDPTLAKLREEAEKAKIWLLIGSLAIKTNDADGRFANRSFLVHRTAKSPLGTIKSICLMSTCQKLKYTANPLGIAPARKQRSQKRPLVGLA